MPKPAEAYIFKPFKTYILPLAIGINYQAVQLPLQAYQPNGQPIRPIENNGLTQIK